MSVIISLGKALPAFEHHQKDILMFMIKYLELNNREERTLTALYRNSLIEKRYSVLPDFSLTETDPLLFLGNGNTASPCVEKRMNCFRENALPLAEESIRDCFAAVDQRKISFDKITHLITVSCTGMSAPGLEIDLMRALNLSPNVSRIGINFMGCYGIFHALKVADALCNSDENAMILIAGVELCTIHFQKKSDNDNLIANSLFADGAGAVLITSDQSAEKNSLKGILVKKFFSGLLADGKQDMAWQISSSGFLMTLSSHIPALLEKEIAPLTQQALSSSSLDSSGVDFYAIHPGGRKILEAISKSLYIKNGKMESSFDVLKNFGNMSSVTILFVLKEIWDKKADWKKCQNIFAAGFGPGLTLESAVLQTVNFN